MTADTSADELKSVASAYPEMDAEPDRLAVQLAMLRQQNYWSLWRTCHKARFSTAGSAQYV